MRFRTLALLLVVVPAAIFLASEWAYRLRFRRELGALKAEVLARHPNRLELSTDYGRFCARTPRPKPSLLKDVVQGLRHKLGFTSDLHATSDPSTSYLLAYYCVHFTLRYPGAYSGDSRVARHVFIWSPRSLRFVLRSSEGVCDPLGAGKCDLTSAMPGETSLLHPASDIRHPTSAISQAVCQTP